MEEKTRFRDLSAKAKIGYIWDYYKLHIAAGAIAIAVPAAIIYTYATRKEPLLDAIMINCLDPYSSDETGFDEYLAACGHDPEKETVKLTSSLLFSEGEYSLSYNDYQVLTVLLAAGDQDVFFGTGQVYLDYADQGALSDLSKALPADLLERYSDHLIYSDDGGTVDPYPCAIELVDNAWVKKYNYYDTCYFGILYRSDAPDAAAEFARFLLEYPST